MLSLDLSSNLFQRNQFPERTHAGQASRASAQPCLTGGAGCTAGNQQAQRREIEMLGSMEITRGRNGQGARPLNTCSSGYSSIEIQCDGQPRHKMQVRLEAALGQCLLPFQCNYCISNQHPNWCNDIWDRLVGDI